MYQSCFGLVVGKESVVCQGICILILLYSENCKNSDQSATTQLS